uniref:Uncharacterized protein n=1 Tax=Cucumis melo TaxID=3656 RepID=A0A9I9DPX2_CUCME
MDDRRLKAASSTTGSGSHERLRKTDAKTRLTTKKGRLGLMFIEDVLDGGERDRRRTKTRWPNRGTTEKTSDLRRETTRLLNDVPRRREVEAMTAAVELIAKVSRKLGFVKMKDE